MSTLLAPFVFALMRPVPVIIAAAIILAIGFVWYGPLFGKTWRKLGNGGSGGNMWKLLGLNIVCCLVQAAVLGRLLTMTRASGVLAPLSAVVVYWLAFTLATFAVQYAYARRPIALLAIDAFFFLISWEAVALLYYVWF